MIQVTATARDVAASQHVDCGCQPASERAHWLVCHLLPHEPALRNWLNRHRVDGIEVDDIVQETYAVMSALTVVNHIESPQAYMFKTAQSVVRRHLRHARVVKLDALDEVRSLAIICERPSPERHAIGREQLRQTIAIISGLPTKCREAFVMQKLQGLGQREVARAMGVSESTIEKHIGRGLRALSML